jgi:hypothetical protein
LARRGNQEGKDSATLDRGFLRFASSSPGHPAALGYEQGHIAPGDRIALLGIGGGLSSIMLGVEEAL